MLFTISMSLQFIRNENMYCQYPGRRGMYVQAPPSNDPNQPTLPLQRFHDYIQTTMDEGE